MKKTYFFIILTISFSISLIAQPTRNWATYYGGTGDDYLSHTAVDGSGNVYVVGYTNSNTGIATTGAYQTFVSGGFDAYLVKFNSAGVRQWATYYGGSGNEYQLAIAADLSGNVYISGQTLSTSNISTVGSHQPTYGGGPSDAFLVKFNTAGVRQWATYYGDIQSETGNCLTVDASGNVYLAGVTQSSSAISTLGSHQPVYSGGGDAYVVKFNSSGLRQWATYYGGPTYEAPYSVVVDGSGNVCISGYTNSTSNISTVGSHQPTIAGLNDNFIAKFNSLGVRQWGTYYGGTQDESENDLAVDAGGNLYIAGYTVSTTGISSLGSFQPANAGGYDAYLAMFNSSGVRQWGTYIGGAGLDRIISLAVNGSGSIYVGGYTTSTAGISSPGSYQPIYGGGSYDAFIANFSNTGLMQWSTYYGGTNYEEMNSLAVDTVNGYVYGTGGVYSLTNISTTGSYQPIFGGGTQDTYLVQFDGCLIPTTPGTISGTATICSGTSNTYSITAVSGATSYTWTLPSGWTGTSITNSITTTASTTSGNITVTANNTCGNSTAQTLAVTVNTIPTTPGTISGTPTICSGTSNTYSITAVSGATSYAWTMPSGWTGTSTTNSITTTASSTSGNITVTANNTCGNSTAQTLAITVNSIPTTPGTISGAASMCVGAGATTYNITSVGGATSYTWTLPGGWSGTSTSNTINATPGTTGGTISVTANNTCGNSTPQTLAVTINPLPTVTYTQSPSTVCINATAVVLGTASPSGGTFSGTAVTGSTFNASVAGSGTFPIVYTFTDVNSCTNTASSNIIVDACTGVQQNVNKYDILIYPNPASNTVNIIIDELKYTHLTIINVLGKKIFETELTEKKTEIDLNSFQNGIYFIQLNLEQGTVTKKIIKE